ncbi:ABC transporter substrate-binding protein [Agromyces bauzanensis]|uniref:Peptide ABC transporter permease n=1 Tax=Agromyces bauzanensis TaxID=1308924 RepID=A0A917PLI9_9MICO|nr:ABC transporter substrate-binding protein [Agromyces bauzanensis]GGJ83076.1 peptide ABC transporter permease [Agromyces bauzanensis]
MNPYLASRRGHRGGRLTAVAGATLAVGVALAGCAGSADGPETSATAEPTPGGDLIIGTYLDPTCIDNQQLGTNVSLSITRQLVDSLTEQDPETGEVTPWLAESWEVNEDSSAFTFALRDDVTFSDGSEFTAQVVKDNIDGIVALGAKAPIAGPYVAGLEAATVIDDHTIEISFSRPNAQFLQATANIAMGMVSSETAAMTADERCAAGVVGTGPFVLESYTANDATVITKREGYDWAPPAADHDGDAYLDSVTFQVLPENSVRTGALLSGQIDAMDSVQQQDEGSLSGNGFSMVTRANPGFAVSVMFRLDSEVVSDPAVRQAMMMGVDRADVLTVLGPTGAETLGVLTPTTPGADDFSEFLEYDPEGAVELLEDAGWAEGDDGIREKDGVRLELEFPYFFDGPVVELLQQQYAEIGIRLNTSQMVVADFLVALESDSFDATVGNLTRADIDVLRSTLSNTGTNYYSLADADLQSLLEAQAAEPDPATRVEIAGDIQESVLENAYVVPLHALAAAYAVRDGVNDLQFEASSRLWLYDTWMVP